MLSTISNTYIQQFNAVSKRIRRSFSSTTGSSYESIESIEPMETESLLSNTEKPIDNEEQDYQMKPTNERSFSISSWESSFSNDETKSTPATASLLTWHPSQQVSFQIRIRTAQQTRHLLENGTEQGVTMFLDSGNSIFRPRLQFQMINVRLWECPDTPRLFECLAEVPANVQSNHRYRVKLKNSQGETIGGLNAWIMMI